MPQFKCNLIVPGFAKCGTSSLHRYLDMHPKICMSSPRKEPHFFTFPEEIQKGPKFHNTLFDHAENEAELFGESSTSYCVWEPSMHAIQQSLENPKFIVMLRHPVDRLISHYKWMYALGLESNFLEAAIDSESQSDGCLTDIREGCFPWYLRHSSYQHFGSLLLNTFGHDKVLFLKSEELRNDRLATLNSVFEFLGVESLGEIEEVVANVTSRKSALRSPSLQRLRSLTRALTPTSLLDMVDPKRRVVQAVLKIAGTKKPPEPAEATIQSLHERLKADIEFYEQK